MPQKTTSPPVQSSLQEPEEKTGDGVCLNTYLLDNSIASAKQSDAGNEKKGPSLNTVEYRIGEKALGTSTFGRIQCF